jgi:hypothetical protein
MTNLNGIRFWIPRFKLKIIIGYNGSNTLWHNILSEIPFVFAIFGLASVGPTSDEQVR